MKLKKDKFGRTSYRISELCLSTSNFSRYTSPEESFAILDSFHKAGGNLIQTSGICPGVNLGDGFLGLPEELLGRWLKVRRINRADVIIATRIALTRPVIGGMATYTELIRSSADDSIRRIACGYLDFLVVEWTNAINPVAESIAAFEAVVASSEVRHVVPANFPVKGMLESFAATHRESRTIAGLQVDYSLATRLAFEGSATKLSADHGLGIIARSPLAGGHLACRRFSPGLGFLHNGRPNDRPAAVAAERLWPALTAIARIHHCSPAQVALSWVLSHPQVTSVLVSVSSLDQLTELLAATRLELSDTDIVRLESTCPRRARNALAS